VPEIALRAENLSKRFGGLRAVSEVSIELRVGEVHAVIGPNGAGKSTLINLLSGDLHVSEGSIAIGDRVVTGLGPDKRGRAGIGRSYQKTTLFPRWTAFENARIAAQARSPRALNGWTVAERDESVNARAWAALDQVGLEARADIAAALLSHGEQRQLEIAMVLATEPSVVLLDEPLAGMGTSEARSMIELIARVKVGRAVLLVEHDMDAVFSLADVLTVMADGRIIAQGAPEAVRVHPAVRAAYLGHEDAAV
jgi:branched-chain amino acid transport system ATP-binding protein